MGGFGVGANILDEDSNSRVRSPQHAPFVLPGLSQAAPPPPHDGWRALDIQDRSSRSSWVPGSAGEHPDRLLQK